jgi:hypothetical protein
MSRVLDPVRRQRERQLLLERRELAQTEARAVADGVVETVALSAQRGSAFEHASSTRTRRETPYRRQAGLEWLASKGRLTPAMRVAGERYGAVYRRARMEGSMPSTLGLEPRSSAPGGAPLSSVLEHAEGTAQAKGKLLHYRRQLCGQANLIGACDLICGQELTPREAAANDRDAGKLEAVLLVALDILVSAAS